MTLAGYTVAVTAPQQHLVTVHLRQCGAKVVELPWKAPLRQLVRMVIKREVHAVCFINAKVAAAMLDFAGRAGLRADLLAAFATDVLAAGAARPFIELAIPALCVEVDEELAQLVAAASWCHEVKDNSRAARSVGPKAPGQQRRPCGESPSLCSR